VSHRNHLPAIANTISRALKEERKTELRLEAAHNNVKKLRRHCKTLKETSATDKTATADAFLAFAQNECLELCTRVYKVFPREIRDTIYSYITGHEEVNVSCDADPWGDFTPVKYTIGQLDVFSSLSARTTDHWWKPEHVGPETVREIGENFYRSSCFVFHNNLAAVGPFRATDIWGLGFLPVDFVSKVEVSVNCSEYKFELLDRAGINTTPNQPSSRASYKTKERRGKSIYHTQNYLLVQLESLFGFKHGTALTIRISSHDREERSTLEQQEWMSHHVVPVILPILQRLKEAGCRVRLLLSVDTVWGFQRFTSKWNEVCLEAITKDFWEVIWPSLF
jgi:hypothetical protein